MPSADSLSAVLRVWRLDLFDGDSGEVENSRPSALPATAASKT